MIRRFVLSILSRIHSQGGSPDAVPPHEVGGIWRELSKTTNPLGNPVGCPVRPGSKRERSTHPAASVDRVDRSRNNVERRCRPPAVSVVSPVIIAPVHDYAAGVFPALRSRCQPDVLVEEV